MQTTTHMPGRHRERGFAILEALVALLVLSFGLMALVAFQSTLSLHSDIAKQRSEATRLAQQEIDTLRAFRQREADGTIGDSLLTYAENLVTAGVDRTVTSALTNTTFTVNRVVTVPPGDRYRWLRVAVAWTDRAGRNQSVVMNTAVSDGDPGDLGGLGVVRARPATLRPKNRNINIPYPAVTLDGGQLSAFIPPPGNVAFVFDNVTGDVVNRCTNLTVPLTEGINLIGDATIATCDPDFRAYLLSGYVRFVTDPGPAPTTAYLGDPDTQLTDLPLPLLATNLLTDPRQNPFIIDSLDTGNAPNAYECYAQQQKTVRNNSLGFEVTVPETATEGSGYPVGYNSLVARFIAYTCIVTAIDHDSDAATPRLWSGEVRLVTDGTWDTDSGSGAYRTCRLSSDYNRNGALSNHEHPRYYRHVTGALDNQNFLVIDRADACPTDVRSNPLTGDFLDTNTAHHQPGSELSFWCQPGPNCTGNPYRQEYESAVGSPSAFIPME